MTKPTALAYLPTKTQISQWICPSLGLPNLHKESYGPKVPIEHTVRTINEPHREKTGLRGVRAGLTQTGLYSHRTWLEA